MEKENYSDLSNAELQLQSLVFENKFESLKAKISKLCEELRIVEYEYNKIQNEINLRKRIF